jgi:Domain of unknown function (DUF932)/DEAD/DEAH box helicase
VLENPDTRALYLFPTKALAQDQLAELHDLAKRLDDCFGVFTYDGDAPNDARKAIRERGHVVLTNPDMLHTGILPHHTKWMRLFENLRYVVLDELHTYRGVFGSHLANVLRRLRRIARFYGSNPQFICCSATIANPGERVWILAKLPKDIPVIGDDITNRYLLLSNGHDGTSAVQIKFTPVRVVCENTLTQALSQGPTLRITHTRDLRERVMIAQNLLKRIQVRYDELAIVFQKMAKRPVNNGKLDEYLKGTFPDPTQRQDETRHQRALPQAQ